MTFLQRALPCLAVAMHSQSALAHGDMSVFLPIIAQLAFLVAPLVVSWRTTKRDRINAFGAVLVSIMVVDAITADVPYVPNKAWLLPLLMLTPPLAWAGFVLYRSRLRKTPKSDQE